MEEISKHRSDQEVGKDVAFGVSRQEEEIAMVPFEGAGVTCLIE